MGRWLQKRDSYYSTWKPARKTNTAKWQFGKKYTVYRSETDQDTVT